MQLGRGYRYELNSSQLALGQLQLVADDVSLSFGGVRALRRVSLKVSRGEIHSIIGPNGAGKTSLLNCIGGMYRPQDGAITLHEKGKTTSLVALAPHKIAKAGVARSFQNIELFQHMTVLENMMLGRHIHLKNNLLASLCYVGPARRQEFTHREIVEEVIDLLHLQSVRHQPVGSLAYGIQKRVEIGRALCMQPAILLLDEPIAGMNAEEKEDMARYILDVNQLAGITVLLIEHDMAVVMDISDQVTALDFGQVIATGLPQVVQNNQKVIDAYLGQESA